MLREYIDGYTTIYVRDTKEVVAIQNKKDKSFFIANEYIDKFTVKTYIHDNNITGFQLCPKSEKLSLRELDELNSAFIAYVRLETTEDYKDPDNFVQELFSVELGEFKIKELLGNQRLSLEDIVSLRKDKVLQGKS